MAIVKVDPQDWQGVNTVQIDSDAIDNALAIREIDEWASEHGFARTNEYWLRQVILTRDGRRVFRGICYRLTQEIRESTEATLQKIAETAARNPLPATREDEGR
jgi:hypothetical protein